MKAPCRVAGEAASRKRHAAKCIEDYLSPHCRSTVPPFRAALLIVAGGSCTARPDDVTPKRASLTFSPAHPRG